MARTNNAAVMVILDTSLSTTQIDAFIATANLIVTEQLGDEGLSSDLLTEIEKYLAAHLCTLRDPRASKLTADGVSVTHEGTTGMGLDASIYGQQVQVLDPTGKLAALSDAERKSFLYRVGSEASA